MFRCKDATYYITYVFSKGFNLKRDTVLQSIEKDSTSSCFRSTLDKPRPTDSERSLPSLVLSISNA